MKHWSDHNEAIKDTYSVTVTVQWSQGTNCSVAAVSYTHLDVYKRQLSHDSLTGVYVSVTELAKFASHSAAVDLLSAGGS